MLNTIGYEGASLVDFLDSLEAAEVQVLVDVRDRAQSRKKGFSKTALSNALSERGIRYVHFRELGDPKEGREAARKGDWKTFDKIYRQVMLSDSAKSAISSITNIIKLENACLLCYERDHTSCHRKYISDHIDQNTGSKTRHLGVRKIAKAA